jgi:pimeloyl-ACP methyl ester carboxylesterase
LRVPFQFQNVEVREEGRGPTIVLVHGYPFDGDLWLPVSRLLSKSFRVLRPDFPGRRDTPRPQEPSLRAYAAWLAAVVGAADARVGIAGFSMGGYALLEFLRQKPPGVAAAAFINTQAGSDSESARRARDEVISMAREMGPRPVTAKLLRRLLSPASLGNETLIREILALMETESPWTLEADVLAMRDRPDSRPFLPEIPIPSLVVSGADDALISRETTQELARLIPGASLVEIPGVGHLSPLEKPADVAAAMEKFFTRAL